MKGKEKPKYNTLQNVWWMLRIAWKNRKRVLLFCFLTASLEVLFNLTQLYIAPEVIARVEQKVPILELLATIGVFTAALFLIHGLKEYIKQNTLFPRVAFSHYCQNCQKVQYDILSQYLECGFY